MIESYAVELRRLLGRINADVSNDAFSTADLLKECRHEFFRALMDGRATSEEDVLRHLRLIRSKMDPTKPCVVAELEIPADNDFLRGRGQYGSDRLEVALRNIFGVEAHGLRILACVLPGIRRQHGVDLAVGEIMPGAKRAEWLARADHQSVRADVAGEVRILLRPHVGQRDDDGIMLRLGFVQ